MWAETACLKPRRGIHALFEMPVVTRSGLTPVSSMARSKNVCAALALRR